MSRIFITGDTHGDYDTWSVEARFDPEIGETLTKDDYLIIVGDVGCCWVGNHEKGTRLYYQLEAAGLLDHDDEIQKYWEDKPYTVLFIDGNHENHAQLDSYPVEEWHGGKVHFIKPHLIHLMRGQVYDIAGKTFFTMGGAQSTDKAYRVEDLSWWAREMPSKEELDEGIENLKKHNMKVDVVLTHCAPEKTVNKFMQRMYYRSNNQLTDYLEELIHGYDLKFRDWFFGHYHSDEDTGYFNPYWSPEAEVQFHLMYHKFKEVA